MDITINTTLNNSSGEEQMNTVLKKYNDQACDVFDNVHTMSIFEAKWFIEDAHAKREQVRKMIQLMRKDRRSICMTWRAYRKAHKLSVKAYNKCLVDMNKEK